MEIASYNFDFNGKPATVEIIIKFIKDKEVGYVFFDFGGTVVDLSHATKEKMVQCINTTYHCDIDQDELDQTIAKEWFSRRSDPIDQTSVKNVKDEKGEEEYWLSFYSSILERLGIKDIDAQVIQQLATWQSTADSFEVFPFFEELLGELDKLKIKAGIISNGFPSARRILNKKGLEHKFKPIILSCDSDCYSIKPEREIYQLAVDKMELKLSLDNILLIDDHKSFVDAAVEFGMQGALITHKVISVRDNIEKNNKGKNHRRYDSTYTRMESEKVVQYCFSFLFS